MSGAPIVDQAERSSAASRWRLEPAGSKAEFRVPNFWGLITVKGRFDRFNGWFEVDYSGRRRIELTLDATSVHTGNPMRDRHLRAADFFDAERYPEVQFHSTSISDPGDGPLRVEGELAAAGNRVVLRLEAILQQDEDRLEIEASTVLDQRQLGMTWSPLGMTRTPATLHVHALMRREQ